MAKARLPGVSAGSSLTFTEGYLHRVPGLRTLRLDAPTVQEPVATEYRPSPPEKVVHRLKVDGLAVTLGGRPVLHNLSLAVDSGQTVAVAGRNGAGKTALLRAPAGLQKYEGRVAVNGDPPDFGTVFQDAAHKTTLIHTCRALAKTG